MLTHIPILDESVFIDTTIFFLCTGSFYLIYKFQKIFDGEKKTSLKHIYRTSLCVNTIIFILVVVLHADLIKSILLINENKLNSFIITIISIIIGFNYLKIEEWICKTKKHK